MRLELARKRADLRERLVARELITVVHMRLFTLTFLLTAALAFGSPRRG